VRDHWPWKLFDIKPRGLLLRWPAALRKRGQGVCRTAMVGALSSSGSVSFGGVRLEAGYSIRRQVMVRRLPGEAFEPYPDARGERVVCVTIFLWRLRGVMDLAVGAWVCPWAPRSRAPRGTRSHFWPCGGIRSPVPSPAFGGNAKDPVRPGSSTSETGSGGDRPITQTRHILSGRTRGSRVLVRRILPCPRSHIPGDDQDHSAAGGRGREDQESQSHRQVEDMSKGRLEAFSDA